jgi:hypothetical protein
VQGTWSEKAPDWRWYQGDQRNLMSAFMASLCSESSSALGRDLVTEKQYSLCGVFQQHGLGVS